MLTHILVNYVTGAVIAAGCFHGIIALYKNMKEHGTENIIIKPKKD